MHQRKRLRSRLAKAQDAQTLAVVSRRPKYSGKDHGFVVGIGSKWMLVRLIDDAGAFDGYLAVRIRDIAKVVPDVTFAVRAAPELPHWPPMPPDGPIDLDTTRGLLKTLAAASPSGLLGIEKERERCAQWIGVFDEIIGKFVYLMEVGPDGVWDEQPLGYRIRDITSVGIGGLYRDALARYVDWDAKPG